jgi:anaerobic magnesium-protoporphyrin IX monomethyl ester cyclase
MDIVLINPVADTFELGKSIMPPLGLAMMAAVLERDGYSVGIIDCMVEGYTYSDLQDRLKELNPRIVGVTGATMNRFDSFATCQAAKAALPDATVVYGGVHATFTTHDTLENILAIDIVCRGEGEFTVLELVQAVLEGKELREIAGLSYRHDGQIYHNPDRPFIQNLDELPWPARHLLPIGKYEQKLPFLDVRAALVMSSRGCPVRCSFCSTSVMWGRRSRCRSPQNVVDEIEFLMAEYGVQGVWFFDDTLTLKRAHINGLIDEIQRRGLEFPWYCEVRANTVDYELLKRMREAGCYYISFGVESASPRILKVINKGITLEQVQNLIRWAEDLSMYTKAFFILGLPEETYHEGLQTVQFIKTWEKRLSIFRLSIGLRILPGTDVEKYARDKGYLAQDFSWAVPYYSAKALTLGQNPREPILIQPQMGYAELIDLKYEALGKELLTVKGFKRVLKRLSSWQGLKKYGKKYLLEMVEILRRRIGVR